MNSKLLIVEDDDEIRTQMKWALGKDYEIHLVENRASAVETSQNNGWAVLSVSDNGCGMNPEFLNHSLFRPFQTTKKNGLGIGLFQSKMIVEAHRGRIQVESQPGKGTTFRIILPIPNQIYEYQTTSG